MAIPAEGAGFKIGGKAVGLANAPSPRRVPLHRQQFQPKTVIELAAVLGAATGETGDCAFDHAYAREIAPAIRATVDETRRILLRRKRQRMAAPLACDSQIATSLLPLGSMR